jgi:putative endonuclease
MRRVSYVYILASQTRGTLYIGVTNDVARRLAEHRSGTAGSFTARYRVFRLVHVEEFATAAEAIQREKSLKKWPRKWKIDLVERDNPTWTDLARWPLWVAGIGSRSPAMAWITGSSPVMTAVGGR